MSTKIPSIILLLSPGARHEGDSVGHEDHGQQWEVRKPYFDHPFWPRTREEFYQGRAAALERAREWALLQVVAPTGGLAE